MATDWQSLALDQAELLSTRLKDLISYGQGYIRSQFGIEVGLTPELYPTWAVLSTAIIGLLVVLVLSWAVLCGGLGGKKRGAFVNPVNNEPLKAPLTKVVKPEEFKNKKNKKKSEKKAEHNGRPLPVPQEEVKVKETSTPSPEVKHDKVQAPVQVKNKKKKVKPEVKTSKNTSASTDGKEPEDGAWETKVSNREKKQQRRKDKGPEGSGSPGGMETPISRVELPAVPAPVNPKKTREPLHSRASGKGDAVTKTVSSSWREEPPVNGGGRWAEVPLKHSGQISSLEGDKWPAMPTTPRQRAQPESWVQETQGKTRGMDGRIKTELNPVSFSIQGSNTAEPVSCPVDQQWDSHAPVEDDWSGVCLYDERVKCDVQLGCVLYGLAAADPSSDWNAPVVPWVNSEEPPLVMATIPPPPNEQPAPQPGKLSDEENEDPAGEGAAKSKKKKKKKKKPEEEGASAPVRTDEHTPAVVSAKQPSNVPFSQKKSEQVVEPAKPSQKKKVRRET
ncbi:metadherin a [Aplochiton taeniatus]